jgi:hypothetical protein
MSMLEAAGVPLVPASPVAHEADETLASVLDALWVARAAGKAFKLLDPHLHVPPQGPRYAVIWLDRDTREQVLSGAKFIKHLDGRSGATTMRDLRAWQRSLRMDRGPARAVWTARGARMLTLSFEEILASPRGVATLMREFLGVPFDVDAAAAEVIPRPPQCLPFLLELGLIRRHAEREAAKAMRC